MIVQISDCHVVAGPAGDGAAAALAQVVDAVNALPVTPAVVLVSGDLTNDGAPESYARVAELLGALRAPYVAFPGNHDDGERFRELFGDRDELEAAGLRVLLVDTVIPGSDAGRLDAGALAERLSGDDRPTVIAMHHPPLRTGVPAIDMLVLPPEARTALQELLEVSPQVKGVICGHVHRITFETLGGCGIFTGPATYEQAEPGPEPGTLAFVERGRAYAIHTWFGGSFVSQIQAVA